MKAKEYVARYKQSRARGMGAREAQSLIISGLCDDALATARLRGGNAIVGANREADQKWRSIAYALDWNPNAWRELMQQAQHDQRMKQLQDRVAQESGKIQG